MSKKPNQNERMKFYVIIAAIFVVIFAFLALVSLGIYKYDWQNRFMKAVETVIPFPAVHIKGAGTISVREIKGDIEAVRKFYESQNFDQIGMRVDFSTDQGKKRLKLKEKDILNKLIENKVIEKLAKAREISINDATIDEEIDRSIDQYGNRQNLMSELNRLYGWTLEDFKKKVVGPELYAEKLADAFVNEVDNAPQEKKIKSLYERVTSKKEDFAKVASEASEGQSSANGGDLGWSTKEQLISEVGDKAFSMKTGQVSEVISSPLGFHIIKLEDIKTDNGENMVHLRQIFVKKITFSDWLKEQMKKYPVTVFLRGYQWNSSEAAVEFSDPEMQQFEQTLPANSEGDPSIF
jgi:parvulin-like peptidyl-prolyl isomerase